MKHVTKDEFLDELMSGPLGRDLYQPALIRTDTPNHAIQWS